jgi:hypothetical protein
MSACSGGSCRAPPPRHDRLPSLLDTAPTGAPATETGTAGAGRRPDRAPTPARATGGADGHGPPTAGAGRATRRRCERARGPARSGSGPGAAGAPPTERSGASTGLRQRSEREGRGANARGRSHGRARAVRAGTDDDSQSAGPASRARARQNGGPLSRVGHERDGGPKLQRRRGPVNARTLAPHVGLQRRVLQRPTPEADRQPNPAAVRWSAGRDDQHGGHGPTARAGAVQTRPPEPELPPPRWRSAQLGAPHRAGSRPRGPALRAGPGATVGLAAPVGQRTGTANVTHAQPASCAVEQRAAQPHRGRHSGNPKLRKRRQSYSVQKNVPSMSAAAAGSTAPLRRDRAFLSLRPTKRRPQRRPPSARAAGFGGRRRATAPRAARTSTEARAWRRRPDGR